MAQGIQGNPQPAGGLRQRLLQWSVRLAQFLLNEGWLRLETARRRGSAEGVEKAKRSLERAKALGRAAVSGKTAFELALDKLKQINAKKLLRSCGVLAAAAVVIIALCNVGSLVEYASLPRATGSPQSGKSRKISLEKSAEMGMLKGVEIAGNPVKIRPKPSAEAESLGEVFAGDGVLYKYLGEQTGDDGKVWFKIEYGDAPEAWVSSSYARKAFSPPAETTYNAATIADIAEKYSAVGVQAAMIKDGKVNGSFAWGWATVGAEPMTENTAIRAGSLSKIALAMNVMSMQEKGIVNINSDISRYWGFDIRNPEFPDTPITLRSLLCETSSLVYHDYANYSLEDTRRALRDAKGFDGKKEPGRAEAWSACSFATGVVGSTLELASGGNLFEYSENGVFADAGINTADSVRASFASGRVTGSVAALYDIGHCAVRSSETQRERKGSRTPGENISCWAGGLTISAKDMAALIAVLADDGEYNGVRVLSPQSVAAMETFIFEAEEYGVDFFQCLPMRYRNGMYDGRGLYYQTGNAYGVLSVATYDPVSRCGVVVITTGAQDSRDEFGVYRVCGEICTRLYELMKQ